MSNHWRERGEGTEFHTNTISYGKHQNPDQNPSFLKNFKQFSKFTNNNTTIFELTSTKSIPHHTRRSRLNNRINTIFVTVTKDQHSTHFRFKISNINTQNQFRPSSKQEQLETEPLKLVSSWSRTESWTTSPESRSSR